MNDTIHTRSGLIGELLPEARWLSSGFLLTFCSGFGQTYFIALFAGHLKETLSLSDGQFGSLYTAGTLCSAALLTWAGKFPDKFPIRWVGACVLAGLSVMALGMASVSSVLMLGVVLFGLRFFGQGMCTHVAMTAMGRWYNKKRGRAVSIAGLGLSTAEAVLPLAAVAIVAAIGWRMTWVAIAAALAAVAVPVFVILLKRKRVPSAAPATHHPASGEKFRRQWTRSEVLKDPAFYALMPGFLAPPFILTGIFFNQVAIVHIKGWNISWFAACFPILAGVNVLSALAAGWLVDRFGARHILPGFLIPLALSTALLAYASSAFTLPVFMAIAGLTMGSASTISGALWAELYGTEHLGAIRSVAVATIVFSTALSPGLIGVLMDAGVPLMTQLFVMAAYCVAAAIWMGALMPRLNRLAAS